MMAAATIQSDVYTDFQGLSELRARAGDNSEETLREAAGQFEALFIQMMLKSMRDASLGEGIMDSEHTKTYQSMFDRQISIDLSKGSGLGLAELMVRQLSRSPQSAADSQPAPPTPGSRVSNPVKPIEAPEAPVASPVNETPEQFPDWRPQTPEAFVRELWPHAQRAARQLGTEPEALIAQSALETGWGQHMIRGTDGRNSFNLFGIKADARWQGESVVTETLEFRDGLVRKERASFRAYQSPAESFNDYAEFIRSNPRYREALSTAGQGAAFSHALSRAGYATDPEYASKINRIMDSDRLRDALSGVKEATAEPLS
jgi:flagellar protein FlgJ